MAACTPCHCDTSISKNEGHTTAGIYHLLLQFPERLIPKPEKKYLDRISALNPEYLSRYK